MKQKTTSTASDQAHRENKKKKIYIYKFKWAIHRPSGRKKIQIKKGSKGQKSAQRE
jgi:hypothetical protein